MATTVTPATLKVTIQEEVTLAGHDYGGKHVLRIADVVEVSRRIVEVPISKIEILAFQATNPGSGTFDEADVRYIRITNLDDANFVTLIFKNENNDECAHKLDYGQSFIFAGDRAGGVVDTHDAIDGTGLTVVFGDLVNISATADTAAVDLEIVVAGV